MSGELIGAAAAKQALDIIEKTPEILNILNENLNMPNIPLPVMDGEVFWQVLAETGRYKLEQNHITKHARLLEIKDGTAYRIAWGGLAKMEKALDEIIRLKNKY